MDDWTKSLNEGIPVDIIYLDYMKAFYKVSHRHLLHKLYITLVYIIRYCTRIS